MIVNKQIFSDVEFIPQFDLWDNFKGATVGITGSNGVLGKILHNRFVSKGVKIEAYCGDILDVECLLEWFQNNKFTHFFNFAGIVPISVTEANPMKAFEVNAIGNFYLCKQLVSTQQNCWNFFASSSHVYKPTEINNSITLSIDSPKNKNSIYGQTKLASEKLIELIFKTF